MAAKWEYRESIRPGYDHERHLFRRIIENGEVICELPSAHPTGKPDRNARLIAAAPYLLEALESILDRLGTDPIQDDELAVVIRREIARVES